MELIAIIIVLVIVIYFFASSNEDKTRKIKAEKEVTADLLSKYDPIHAKLQKLIYNKNPNVEKLPELIRQGRQIYHGKKLSDLHSEYYSLLQILMDKKQVNNPVYNECIEKSLLLIEPFILFEIKQYKSFDIRSIPAIEDGLVYYSVFGKTDEVRNIFEMVTFFPELESFQEEALMALRYCEILPDILKAIRERKGVKVSDFKGQFGSDYELIKKRMYYLSKFGIVRTTKKGNANFYEVVM